MDGNCQPQIIKSLIADSKEVLRLSKSEFMRLPFLVESARNFYMLLKAARQFLRFLGAAEWSFHAQNFNDALLTVQVFIRISLQFGGF